MSKRKKKKRHLVRENYKDYNKELYIWRVYKENIKRSFVKELYDNKEFCKETILRNLFKGIIIWNFIK